jgi:hypothetical protein
MDSRDFWLRRFTDHIVVNAWGFSLGIKLWGLLSASYFFGGFLGWWAIIRWKWRTSERCTSSVACGTSWLKMSTIIIFHLSLLLVLIKLLVSFLWTSIGQFEHEVLVLSCGTQNILWICKYDDYFYMLYFLFCIWFLELIGPRKHSVYIILLFTRIFL